MFVVRLDPDNKTTQYCLWLNNEYTLNHVRKRLIAKIPAIKHLLFVDVENSAVKRIIGNVLCFCCGIFSKRFLVYEVNL